MVPLVTDGDMAYITLSSLISTADDVLMLTIMLFRLELGTITDGDGRGGTGGVSPLVLGAATLDAATLVDEPLA